MQEVERLRARLKNVQKNVIEYRMTVAEAKALLKEIDGIVTNAQRPVQIPVKPVSTPPKIIDGGSFS